VKADKTVFVQIRKKSQLLLLVKHSLNIIIPILVWMGFFKSCVQFGSEYLATSLPSIDEPMERKFGHNKKCIQ
jgi:hypothetical protein